MKQSLTQKTILGFIWLGGVKIAYAALQLLVLGILARLLTPSDFGIIGITLVIISFIDIFNDLGFGPAITQKSDLSKEDVYTGFTCSIVLGLLLFALLQIAAPFIASFYDEGRLTEVLRAVSVVLIFQATITTPLGLMYRNMEFKKISLVQLTSYFLSFGVIGTTLALTGFGVWALVFSVISQSVITLLSYLFINRRSLGIGFHKTSFNSLLYFGGGYSISKVFTYLANKGDKLLIGKLIGMEALGFYERGYQIVKHIGDLLGEIIDKVLFSPFARKQDNRELIGQLYLEITFVLSILFFPLTAYVFTNAQEIVLLLLGKNWDTTVTIVQIMSVSMFFLITTRIGSTIAKSLGDVYNRALRTIIYASYILVSVFFLSRYGIIYVSMGVSIGTVLNYILAFGQVKKLTKINISDFLMNHITGIIISLIYVTLSYIFSRLLSDQINYIISLIINGLLLLLSYTFLLISRKKAIITKYMTHFTAR